MIDNPLFSVLIANYNNGKYLLDAIKSIYAQTYTNWEIILIDDASTDNSRELCKQLEKDNRIHVFFNDENKGCGYTKRRCAELANGEICGFLDPDDMLMAIALESHVLTHKEHENVSCVFSRYHYCDENMIIKGDLRLLKIKANLNYFTNKDYKPEHLASFKRALYNKTEGIASDIKLGVDQDLYFKLEETGPVFVLDKFTYLYRNHNNNISRIKWEVTLYWNFVVRQRTCERRKIEPFEYTISDFIRYMERENNVLNSHSYRLGNFILSPLIWLKKVFGKEQ